jgi:hypothetical protein
VTERAAPPDWDAAYLTDDPDDGDGWFGRELVTAPTTADDIYELLPGQPVGDGWDEHDENPPDVAVAPPLEDLVRTLPFDDVAATRQLEKERTFSATPRAWTTNGQLRTFSPSALTFRPPPPPWYRTRQAMIALVGAAAAAAVVTVVVLIVSSPARDAEESTRVSPPAPTSASPAPPSAQPTPSGVAPTPIAPLPPPPIASPPPPPPQQAEQIQTAPVAPRQYYPSPATPPQTNAPEVGVTRTPTTRAPISVAPPPQKAPENNSATPGDGPKRRGGWGW